MLRLHTPPEGMYRLDEKSKLTRTVRLQRFWAIQRLQLIYYLFGEKRLLGTI